MYEDIKRKKRKRKRKVNLMKEPEHMPLVALAVRLYS